jgi:hypothetical protein
MVVLLGIQGSMNVAKRLHRELRVFVVQDLVLR